MNELFLAALNRPPKASDAHPESQDVQSARHADQGLQRVRTAFYQDLGDLNSNEFI